MSETLFADGIRNVSLSNGVVRVELGRDGGQGETVSNGTLMIPANQAGSFASALNNALRELQQRLEQQQSAAAEGAAGETNE